MKAIPAAHSESIPPAAVPMTPRSPVVTAVSWVVRLATMAFIVVAGLLLIQSFRAVFDRSEPPPFSPQADPRDPASLLPRSYANFLEGTWTVAEGDWALSWRTTASPPTASLPTDAPTGPKGELERTVLDWLVAVASPVGNSPGPDHVVQFPSMRVEARTRGEGDSRRLCAARLIRPAADGRWTSIGCEPLRALSTGVSGELLPLPAGCRATARRTDANGTPIAELVPCTPTDPTWRTLLRDRGWSLVDVPPPDAGVRAVRGGRAIRILPLNIEDLPLPNHCLVITDPEADETSK